MTLPKPVTVMVHSQYDRDRRTESISIVETRFLVAVHGSKLRTLGSSLVVTGLAFCLPICFFCLVTYINAYDVMTSK